MSLSLFDRGRLPEHLSSPIWAMYVLLEIWVYFVEDLYAGLNI
jgi:hypothetical protein